MNSSDSARTAWWSGLSIAVQGVLLLVVLAGVVARGLGVPEYAPDSGDEWGNTVAPLRVLFERGDPGVFLHPALYYYVTAAVYAALFALLKLFGVVDGALSMTDLLVRDPHCFVFAARAVSVASAGLAMWALYALGRTFWGRLGGLLAAALLAVLPLHAVYSEAVRVDSLFLAVFLYALLWIVRLLVDSRRATYRRAGLWTGLATGANYNGAILVPWLIGAHLLRARDGPSATAGLDRSERHHLLRALGLAAAAFVATNPFMVFGAGTFLRVAIFEAGLSWLAHPGVEGRGALFYAAELARTSPLLCGAIAVACLVTALFGRRGERFVLSLAVAYFVLFSLLSTKYDRFVLPALALFLLVASGLPFVLARRFAARRIVVLLAYALGVALLLGCIATLAPRSIPIPRHPALAPPGDRVLDWIEQHAPPGSTILIESGVVPLLDVLDEGGRLGAALRQSLVTLRPGLDQHFLGAVYLGGRSNYEADMLAARHVDLAVISLRNVQYVEAHCDAFAEVCAFYRALRSRGRIAYQTPGGVEQVDIYDVRGS